MTSRRLSILAMGLVVMFLAACSHSPRTYRTFQGDDGGVHIVRPGDTLAALARAYRVPVSRIARANGIDDPDRIYAGQRLVIPGRGTASTGSGLAWQSRTPGIYHPLRQGETLMALERAYGVRAGVLKRINHISDERSLAVGRMIFVPGAERIRHPEPASSPSRPVQIVRADTSGSDVIIITGDGGNTSNRQPSRETSRQPSRTTAPPESPAPRQESPPEFTRPAAPPRSEAPAETVRTVPPTSRTGFIHPLAGKGTLTSSFGPRNGSFHYGTDIAAPAGTAIYAIGSGEVEYVGSTREALGKTLGNFVMVYHPDSGLRSLYAHCKKVMVRSGQKVKRGQVIAQVGHTGRVRGATGNHLHLEIRNEDGTALDPANYVPGVD